MNWALINQIAMTGQVGGIMDLVFPIVTLPDAFFAALNLSGRAMRRHRLAAREFGFQRADPVWVIRFPIGQGPDGVNDRRQNCDGVNAERVSLFCFTHGAAQMRDLPDQQITAAICKADGKEKGAAGAASANVI